MTTLVGVGLVAALAACRGIQFARGGADDGSRDVTTAVHDRLVSDDEHRPPDDLGAGHATRGSPVPSG